MRTAIFAARFDQLDAIRKIATQAARDAGLDDSGIYGVELSMVEACTNIIEHAYKDMDEGDIECTCGMDDEKLTIIIHDHGKSFDFSSVTLPDLDSDFESRPLGGLGVFFMKKSMDDVQFESLGEEGNVLTMVKYRPITPKKDGLDLPPRN